MKVCGRKGFVFTWSDGSSCVGAWNESNIMRSFFNGVEKNDLIVGE